MVVSNAEGEKRDEQFISEPEALIHSNSSPHTAGAETPQPTATPETGPTVTATTAAGSCQIKLEYLRRRDTPLKPLSDLPEAHARTEFDATAHDQKNIRAFPKHDDERNFFSSILPLKSVIREGKRRRSNGSRHEGAPACTVLEKDANTLSVASGSGLVVGDLVAASPPCTGMERRRPPLNLSNMLYLSPLTTVGNLPFRRICKGYGADITCGEMALAQNLLRLQQSEWSLLRRHVSEGGGGGNGLFAIQVATASAAEALALSEVLSKSDFSFDVVDLNCGCPIDLMVRRGYGSSLLRHPRRIHDIVRSFTQHLEPSRCATTIKVRIGLEKPTLHKFIGEIEQWGVQAITIHGRTQRQRYTKEADWSYIRQCAAATTVPVIGNGDIYSFEDYEREMYRSKGQEQQSSVEEADVAAVMIGRGALIKPWLFQEIKEQRHIDVSSSERFEMLRNFVNHGLLHWGSDTRGVETTRRYLLEWLSFLYRYVPLGILERVPCRINERPPYFVGRNDLETLMGSENVADWIRLSEMLLGPVPEGFKFTPKHKSNSYSTPSTTDSRQQDEEKVL